MSFSALSSTTAVVRVGRVVRGNDIAVRDAGASQRQLEFRFSSGQWTLCDLGSSNGTFLNGKILWDSAAEVRDGDSVKIGESTVIEVRMVEAPGATDDAPCTRSKRSAVAKAKLNAVEKKGTADEGNQEEGVNLLPPLPPRRTRGRPRKEKEADPIETLAEKEEPEIAPTRTESNVEGPAAAVKGRRASERLAKEKAVADRKDSAEASAVAEEGRRLRGRPAKGKAVAAKEEVVEVDDTEGSKEAGARGRWRRKGKTNAAPAREPKEAVDDPVSTFEDMDKMTLGEWFDRMEHFLPTAIARVSEETIEELRRKAERFDELVSSGQGEE